MEKNQLYEHNNVMKKKENLYRSLSAAFGISECAFWILYVLRSNIALLTQRDLCEYLYQPKQSVNTGIKKLLDFEYITFSYGDDKRSKYISLTDKGKNFCSNTIDKVIEAEKKALTGLTEKEREMLFNLFYKYTELLDERISLI